MTPFADPSVLLLAVVLIADAVALATVFLGPARRRLRERRRREARRIVTDALEGAAGPPRAGIIKRRRWLLLAEAERIVDAVLPTAAGRSALERLFIAAGLRARLLRDLRSGSVYRRSRAAAALSLLPGRSVVIPLVRALERERSHPVKLFLAAALAGTGDEAVVPTVIDTLKGAPERYQLAVRGILSDFDGGLDDLLPPLLARPEKEIKMLLAHLARGHGSTLLARRVEELASDPDLDVAQAAFRVLASVHAERLDHRRYLVHPDFLIRNLAAESLGRLPRTASLALLFDHLDDPVIAKSACLAVTALIRARPHFLKIVMHRCINETRPTAQRTLTDVLSGFADYILGTLPNDSEGLAGKVLDRLLAASKVNEIANFLNRNRDADAERVILDAIASLLERRPDVSGAFLSRLNERVLMEMGSASVREPEKRPGRKERANRPLLVLFLLVGAALVPAACLVSALAGPAAGAWDVAREFVRRFNSVFAVYALALSLVYLVLLLFSVRGARRQAWYSDLPGGSLLYREGVLPSVSIVSPAYNEEETIVESVRALLHLQYPEYEVIVVNDGSTDHTLARLVDAFQLERTDVFVHGYLHTQEIKAVFANKRYPELLVVDKQNGGKADSLNAGINIARKEYFSGIDADSLLESDALLAMASLFLFSEDEVAAAGGNILPANGCTVRDGALLDTRIPGGHLARFQTVEYLRAFLAGRVGWAELRLLLIISGAFGVFHRRSVINVGGYLTQSGRFGRDTVGEDMELVVRLCRNMRENRLPFAMLYACQANCWTEIPHTLRILASQRDRWQRGLLDILSFHSRLLFNPAYGRVGLVGFPYFLVFEVLGPWLEVEGFLVFLASLAAGWASLPVVALLTAATIGLGLLTSIISVGIAGRRRDYFPLRDKVKLFIYAIIENFGVRQFLNFLRVRGLVRMLGKAQGWGKMERRGWRRAPAAP